MRRQLHPRTAAFAAAASLALAAAACGSTGDDPAGMPIAAPGESMTAEQTETGAATDATAADGSTSADGSTAVPTDAIDSGTTESTTAQTDTTLPGDPFEPSFTPAGAELGAVAIPFDETLDVRELPGSTETVLASLPPLATGIVSTGRAQSLGVRDGWLEVTADGTTGWVPLLNVMYIGGTRDATADIESLVGGTPSAPTMLELGRIVAESVASFDSEVTSRIVAVVAPVEDATGTVTYDVVDLPDDSVAGSRLVVTGQRSEIPATAFAAAVSYELVSVESTILCYRGVSDDICV